MPAVVLTTTSIGRPAENLNYYTPVEAMYLEEMVRWQAQPRYAIARLLKVGFAVYLLLPPEKAKEWLANTNISTWYTSEIERTIAPDEAVDFFVASPYHRGIPLVLVRMGLKPPGGESAAVVQPASRSRRMSLTACGFALPPVAFII